MFRHLFHPEVRVVAVVLACLAASEIGMRAVGGRLSRDVAHLQSFETLARPLEQPAPLGTRRVLFLGNSLTRYGVDLQVIESVASAQVGTVVEATKVTPDNTAIAEWSYAYQNFFSEPRRLPDQLVIGFEHGYLWDMPSQHPQRLARFYCNSRDWPELCHRDLPDFESRIAYLLATNSELLSNRDRVERRVLSALIPDYEYGIQELNARLKTARRQTDPPANYERLTALLRQARRDGVQVLLVAMPVPTAYELDEKLASVVRDGGAALIDCREIAGISDEMFPDGLHMDSRAAAIYSEHLAGQLARHAGNHLAPADTATVTQQPLENLPAETR